jgi:hypothetical protein
MGIISVKEISSGRSGSFDDTFRRSYTRTVRVITDDTATGPIVVAFNPLMPNLWDPYVSHATGEIDIDAPLREKTPRLEDESDPYRWLVELRYDTEGPEPVLYQEDGTPLGGVQGQSPGKPGGGGGMDQPELRPWDISIDTMEYQKPLRLAFDEDQAKLPATQTPKRTVPVVNTAFDQYDPLPTYDTGEEIITITRIEPSFDRKRARAYRFALNSTPFMGAERGEAQMLPIRARYTPINKRLYPEVTYRIRFKEPEVVRKVLANGQVQDELVHVGWQPRLLSQGYRRALLQVGGEPDRTKQNTPILDQLTMTPTNTLHFLNDKDQPLTPQEVAEGSAIVPQTFLAYRYLPFDVFRFNLAI